MYQNCGDVKIDQFPHFNMCLRCLQRWHRLAWYFFFFLFTKKRERPRDWWKKPVKTVLNAPPHRRPRRPRRRFQYNIDCLWLWKRRREGGTLRSIELSPHIAISNCYVGDLLFTLTWVRPISMNLPSVAYLNIKIIGLEWRNIRRVLPH